MATSMSPSDPFAQKLDETFKQFIRRLEEDFIEYRNTTLALLNKLHEDGIVRLGVWNIGTEDERRNAASWLACLKLADHFKGTNPGEDTVSIF